MPSITSPILPIPSPIGKNVPPDEVFCALRWSDVCSLAPLPGFRNATVFDVIEGLTSNLLLSLCGMLLSDFAGLAHAPGCLRFGTRARSLDADTSFLVTVDRAGRDCCVCRSRTSVSQLGGKQASFIHPGKGANSGGETRPLGVLPTGKLTRSLDPLHRPVSSSSRARSRPLKSPRDTTPTILPCRYRKPHPARIELRSPESCHHPAACWGWSNCCCIG